MYHSSDTPYDVDVWVVRSCNGSVPVEMVDSHSTL